MIFFCWYLLRSSELIEDVAKEKMAFAYDVVDERMFNTYAYIEASLDFMGIYINKHAINDRAQIYDIFKLFTNHDNIKELIPLYEIMWLDKDDNTHTTLKNDPSHLSLETSPEILNLLTKCHLIPQKMRFGKIMNLDKPVNSFCYGVMDSNHKYSGTLVAGLDLRKFEDSIQYAIEDNTISFAIYNSLNDIVYESPDKYISTHYGDRIKGYFFNDPPLEDTFINFNSFKLFSPQLIYIHHNVSNNTVVVLTTNQNFAANLIADKLVPLAIDLLFLVLIGTTVTFFVYRRLVRPVLSLSNQAEQIAKGNTESGEQSFDYFELDNLAKAISKVAEQQKLRDENKQLNFLVQKAEAANQAKTAFIQNIQHELRTPLNHILGSSEMLASEYAKSIPKEYRQYIDMINQSGRTLLDTINNIIAVAEYSSGKVTLMEEVCSLKKIINDLLDAFSGRIKAAQLECVSDIQIALPLVLLDKVQFSEALAHIFDNAIKFNKPHGTISVVARLVNDGSIQLEIKDTGIGIAEENISKITGAFNETDSLLAKVHKGLGLGLSVANCIFELHGIRLEVESAINLGTKIIVIIPAIRTKEI